MQMRHNHFNALKQEYDLLQAEQQQRAAVHKTAATNAMINRPDFEHASVGIENYYEHENGYVLYDIVATLPTMGGRVTQAKMLARYSHIDAIDATLRLSGFRNLPTMPPKTWCRNTSLGFLRRRKKQLEIYLQGLIRRPDIAQSHEFRYFMRALQA